MQALCIRGDLFPVCHRPVAIGKWGSHRKRVSAQRQDEGMADVVNLRAARKRVDRQQAEKRAAENRLAHGRSKSERNLEAARRDKTNRDLDLHRQRTGEADEIAGR